jgi:hypothetical protein
MDRHVAALLAMTNLAGAVGLKQIKLRIIRLHPRGLPAKGNKIAL